MGEQQSFIPIDPVDPAEVERPDDRAARYTAALAFNDAYMFQFYRTHLPDILRSRDTIRIRLFLDWWRGHNSEDFYASYPRHALSEVERGWQWVESLLSEYARVAGNANLKELHCQWVYWHIELVRKWLAKAT